jgi:hypothetical protein
MSDEDLAKPYRDARANFREAAKWILGGSAALVALLIGGTTFSQIGALRPDDRRLWLAAGCLALGIALAAIPFSLAVGVLRSDLFGLREFAAAGRWGSRKTARDKADARLRGQLPHGESVKTFSDACERLRATMLTEEEDSEAHKAADAEFKRRKRLHTVVGQVCQTELATIRFDHMVWSIWLCGPVIFLLFLTFAWAATGTKDENALTAKAFVETIRPDAGSVARLKAAGLDAVCYLPSVRVIALATFADGRRTGVLAPSRDTCTPLRVFVLSPTVLVPAT